MNSAKILRGSLFAAGALLVCAVVAIALYLWRNSRPSDAARQLLAQFEARPSVPDADNAFPWLWGFAAPADADPLDLGRRRVAWLRARFENPATPVPDPQGSVGSASETRSPALQRFEEACKSGASLLCTRVFDATVATAVPTALERRQLERYRTLVAYPRWFEMVPFEVDAPLPPFAHAFEGQWLLFIELARAAERGDTARVTEGLERDLAFWRAVHADADILITKMVANAALRRHFFFGSRILRRLPARDTGAAIPPRWRRPFDADELSMLRTLAGEFAFATRVSRQAPRDDRDDPLDDEADDDADGAAFAHRLVERLGFTLNPPQRSLNRLATSYSRAAREFRAPLDEYRAIDARLSEALPDYRSMRIGGYAFRAATPEGERRAALLAAELHARAVAPDAAAAVVAGSELVDPFTRRPFGCDAASATLTFEAPHENGRQAIQTYVW